MRILNTIQKRNKLNKVEAVDDKGVGNANHKYKITSLPNGTQGGFTDYICFQKGARKDPNAVDGILDEDLLEIVRDRLIGFQSGDFATKENKLALRHIEDALFWLNKRKEDRVKRGVLGTYDK